ncbi:MAG: DUF86 domain-containing protein [Planctomycetes bacterium]|nr:DUF86 domain-containing protein [Planctomycetota bacterium]
MRDDPTAVLDIVLACRRLRRFIEGVDEPAFQADEEKRWAVFSQLLLVGEAANRLSGEFRAAHTGISWPEIRAMRNRLIHEYDRINWHLVWRTAIGDVPLLLNELEPLVSSNEPPPEDAAHDTDAGNA